MYRRAVQNMTAVQSSTFFIKKKVCVQCVVVLCIVCFCVSLFV